MKNRLFKIILLLSCVVYYAGAQTNGASVKEAAFGDNERLTYVVSYRATLVPNIEAGEVVFRTSKTTVGDTPAYNIYANAKVFSAFKWFYDLDDTYQTWLDQSTLRPIKFSFRIREGKHRANCDYVYDWNSMRVTTKYHNLKRDPVTRVLKLSGQSYDAVALFYNLRSEDLSGMSVGQRNNLKMVLDDTVRTVTYKFLGKESKSVKKMGTFNTLKFSCTIATSTGESFEDGSEFFLWVTDDKNKMPVYLESPIKVGSVRVTLTKYQNLKHPLSSKTK